MAGVGIPIVISLKGGTPVPAGAGTDAAGADTEAAGDDTEAAGDDTEA